MANIDLETLSPRSFPDVEDESFEFKSSRLTADHAKFKLSCAASAFANTGGGCFLWGVADGTGNPDGGIAPTIGREPVASWIDTVLHKVSPVPIYHVKVYDNHEDRGQLDAGNVIVAVAIHAGIGPFMASDHRYYIRGGVHSIPASHALVEALWARRQVQAPFLKIVLEQNKLGETMVFLKLLNLSNTPAVDVELDINPKLGRFNYERAHFPIRIPVVNRDAPYKLFLDDVQLVGTIFSQGAVITAKYHDIAGNEYVATVDRDLLNSLPPDMKKKVRAT